MSETESERTAAGEPSPRKPPPAEFATQVATLIGDEVPYRSDELPLWSRLDKPKRRPGRLLPVLAWSAAIAAGGRCFAANLLSRRASTAHVAQRVHTLSLSAGVFDAGIRGLDETVVAGHGERRSGRLPFDLGGTRFSRRRRPMYRRKARRRRLRCR